MKEELKQNLKEGTTWIRVLYMLLFALIYWVVEFVIVAIVVFQFLAVLFSRKPNDALLGLGQGLSTYVYQILRFLTYNSNRHPYPFSPWPKGEPEAEPEAKPEAKSEAKPEAKAKTKAKAKSKPADEVSVDEAGKDESGAEGDKAEGDKKESK